MNITEQILLDCGFTKTHTHGFEHNLFQKGEFKITHLIKENTHFVLLKSGCVVHVDAFERLQELYAQETGQVMMHVNLSENILKMYGFQETEIGQYTYWAKKPMAKEKPPVAIGWSEGEFFFEDYHGKTLKTLNELAELYHVLTGETLTPVKGIN